MTVAQHRKRMRLQNFDYSGHHGYFITIDVLDRRCLFGAVAGEAVKPSDFGLQVAAVWNQLSERYPGVLVDERIFMPDHMHGILIFSSVDPQVMLPDLTQVISYFKSVTTRLYHRYKEQHGLNEWPPELWQRSYYERVIRSESDLEEKRSYIRTNPHRWSMKRAGLL
jgi:REP element-mobilizing transposase RayT